MSPSPSAPKIASVSACSPTSASEWPTSAAVERQPHAAERHAVAGAEGVHVEAVAGPDVRADVHASSEAARPLEVGGGGDLEVRLVARNDADRKPGGAGDRHVVGRLAGVGAVRGEDVGEAEALRRLRPPEAVARHRRRRPAAARPPERVDDRQRREGRRAPRRAPRAPRRSPPASRRGGRRRGSAPGRAPRPPAPRARRAPSRRGSRAPATGGRSRGSAQPGDGGVVARPVVGVDHHLHRVDRRMREQRRRPPGRARCAPPRSRYCFGTGSPSRVPRPAATIKPAVRIALFRLPRRRI